MVAAILVDLIVVMSTKMIMKWCRMQWWWWWRLWWCDGDGDVGKGEYAYDKVVMLRKMMIAVEFDQYVGESVFDEDNDVTGVWSVDW
jgi:hypothetical protein